MERMMLSENLCYFLWDLKNHSQKGIITTSDTHATVLQYTNFALSVLTIIIGLVGNTIVIYVSGFMMKEKRSKVWFLNLAVADFIFLLFLPLSAVSLLKNNWPFGSHLSARKMNFPLLFKVNMILPLLASIAYSNTCLNPIVYVLVGRNVKSVLANSMKNIRQSFSRNSHYSVAKKNISINNMILEPTHTLFHVFHMVLQYYW
ncbi:uncharacterized protein O3C94_019223 [Discoglossus pictus]